MKHTSLIIFVFLLFNAFGYSEEQVELAQNEVTIKGTLLSSDDPSVAQPLVILIAGSGPTDRNGNNPQMKNNSLKMLAESLASSGYGVLRYDKRGIAESKIEDLDPSKLSFDSFIEDAVGWSNKYAADVRFNQIILAGHSQGSLVALCAANQCENVDGVISLAGAGEPIHNILKWQLSRTLKPEQQGLVGAYLDTLAGGDTLTTTPGVLAELFHPSVQPFLISWMKYDPAKQAAKLKVPLLIINGTTDIQVTVEQAEKLQAAQKDAKYAIISNMNHILKFTKEENMMAQLELYSDPDLPLHKKLTKTITTWLKQFNK
ncbi:alpha/beta hydrolase [Paracrocinitomix mangrovi]|uniref:alpha/beta hydrolase n=1 Tax=Paracrocinitomix mangrovi TaxID=2862509 RepID=UPI001C8DE7C3|nr:alpha/beta hydrolase [Paracrocinitomix mangrovi]UKN00604.1 alpha/beta hydrolase [Paracrocinitomix mangrovi]